MTWVHYNTLLQQLEQRSLLEHIVVTVGTKAIVGHHTLLQQSELWYLIEDTATVGTKVIAGSQQ
jgi:hypothetical protein